MHEAFVARLFHYMIKQPILAFGPDRLVELRRWFVEHECNMRQLVVEIIAETALPERGKRTREMSDQKP